MDKLATYSEVPYLQTLAIDVAVMGGKKMCLPGEALQSATKKGNCGGDAIVDCKESAEAIVPEYARMRILGRAEQ